MKIGILTQPLQRNYGGILQCYALFEVLKGLGHEVCVLDRHHHTPFLRKLLRSAKRILRYCLGAEKKENILSIWMTAGQMRTISRHTSAFIDRHIPHTRPLLRTKELRQAAGNEHIDAYVVGSDQVWRPVFSPCITNYYIDFDQRDHIIRIAYAASFGVDTWEYDRQAQQVCAGYAKKFDAISVREDSGVTLCRNYLGVAAEHVLDPTMLLRREQYEKLATDRHALASRGNLLTYILDPSPEKSTIVGNVSRKLGLTPFSVMPSREADVLNCAMYPEECTSPAVEQWLRGFMDARYVIVDSFHGCVFSILFNKPFIAIANCSRGETRFTSLLRTFGLEGRLIHNAGELTDSLITAPVDWERCNGILQSERKKSLLFLRTNLNK